MVHHGVRTFLEDRACPVDIRWNVIIDEPPGLHLQCRSCAREQCFLSSGKFRINARGRRVDVWLIYRCSVCDERWNRPLWNRALPSTIGREIYTALLQNDRALARRIAFECQGRTDAGARQERVDRYRIEGDAVDLDRTHPWRITLTLDEPCGVRLDKLLSNHG